MGVGCRPRSQSLFGCCKDSSWSLKIGLAKAEIDDISPRCFKLLGALHQLHCQKRFNRFGTIRNRYLHKSTSLYLFGVQINLRLIRLQPFYQPIRLRIKVAKSSHYRVDYKVVYQSHFCNSRKYFAPSEYFQKRALE